MTALPQGSKTKQHHQNDWSTISLIETGISFRGYRVEQEEGLGTCEKLLAVICKRRYSQQSVRCWIPKIERALGDREKGGSGPGPHPLCRE